MTSATRESCTPHVVCIVCDQLHADAVGFTGNPIVRTPDLDRLASDGVIFENRFVQQLTRTATRPWTMLFNSFPPREPWKKCTALGCRGLRANTVL